MDLISVAAYEALTPALHIVSLLITVPIMLPFFDHIRYAKIVGERAKFVGERMVDGDDLIATDSLEGTSLGLAAVRTRSTS